MAEESIYRVDSLNEKETRRFLELMEEYRECSEILTGITQKEIMRSLKEISSELTDVFDVIESIDGDFRLMDKQKRYGFVLDYHEYGIALSVYDANAEEAGAVPDVLAVYDSERNLIQALAALNDAFDWAVSASQRW